MNRDEWLSAASAGRMFHQKARLASPRKLALFCCAVWRERWARFSIPRSSPCWEGLARIEEDCDLRPAFPVKIAMPSDSTVDGIFLEACSPDSARVAAARTIWEAEYRKPWPSMMPHDLLREILPEPSSSHAAPAVPAEVKSLAIAAYVDRRQDGSLDPQCLAALSDALEEAGASKDLLNHLRGWEPCDACARTSLARAASTVLLEAAHYAPCRECVPAARGPGGESGWKRRTRSHYRGCWALDLVLGKA